MLRKAVAIILAVVMGLTMPCIPAAMADSSAAPDGGTASLFENAAESGLFKNIVGEVKPEDELTQAQMASILNCAFGAADKATLSGFTDVETGAWYYDEMAKAVQMGVFSDACSTLNPRGIVTREEVYKALARVFKLPDGDAAELNSLKDKNSISPDVAGAVSALLASGYISAEDGYLHPGANVTTLEFVQIMDGMVKCYLNREGTYTSVPDGSVMINVPDVTLKDVVVKGDLILGDGVGDGNVTLHNVTVTGRTLIRGGGVHSIRITGTSNLQNIIIARVNGELRVFAEDGTEIGEILVDGKDDVTIEGTVGSITIAADDVTITAVNAQIGSAGITGENSHIIVAAGSAINTLTVDGANAAVEVLGTVTDIVVNGEGTTVSGEGQVSGVEANANDVVVTTPDTLVSAATGVSGVMAGTRAVSEGTTVNTTPEYDGGAASTKPTITSVAPAQGPASGGAAVTITGKDFTGATSVTFGGKAAASYKVVSDTEVSAVTPAGISGAAVVAVTTADGTGTKASAYTYIAAPTVSSAAPAQGPVTGGTTVTIVGTGFTGTTSVTFGGSAASYTVVSDTSTIAVTPAGAAGLADITITTAGGTVTKAEAYVYTPAPSITSVNPNAGPLSGGTTVTIAGSGLTRVTSVAFGGAFATSFTVNSDTSITATVPAGAAGTLDVAVVSAGGSAIFKESYTYVPAPSITSVSPNISPISGSTTVTIAGSGLNRVTSVAFGGAFATSFTVNSDTSITATVPAGAAGTVDVVVVSAGASAILAKSYTYVPAPSITSVSPNVGPLSGGTTVTIAGSGLTRVTSVAFGGAFATSFTVNSDTSITATVPAGAAGTVDVAVVSAGGSAILAESYTYIPAPTITSVGPVAGPAAGGTSVTIAGSGFTGATSVAFDGLAASYTIVSDTEVTAVTPVGAAGLADVTVTTAGGTGTLAAAYTYIPVPSITSVSPNAGPAAGGNTVTIVGSGFTGATVVTTNGIPVLSFTVVSDTAITAVVRGGIPGPADVAVTANGGTGIKTGGYTYVLPPLITFITPVVVSTAGGTEVTITGSNFSNATGVAFGSSSAVSFIIDSDSQIRAITPTGSFNPTEVKVTTIGGTSAPYVILYFLPPAITSVSPSRGPAAGGGTPVTITGSGFMGITSVTFGGTAAVSFTVNSITQITAVAPAGIAGQADVAVTTIVGTGTALGAYTYIPAPSIASVTPNAGPLAGGTTVTITGTGFMGVASLTLDGVPLAFTVISDTSITFTAPAALAGTVGIAITSTGGTGTNEYTYVPVPTLTSVNPAAGPASGGNTVTIAGSGLTRVTSVAFGGAYATTFTVNSDTSITATAPAASQGTVDVAVVSAGGSAVFTAAYTYIPAPAITSVTPNAGPLTGGTIVTITGTGFADATAVNFGATPATSFTVDTDTKITAVTPAGTAGPANISVTTAGGTATAAGAYTYVPVPVITSVSPEAGPVTGGNLVVILCSNLTGVTSVKFGATEATSFTLNFATSTITAVAPSRSAGTVNVSVTTAGGTATKANAYDYALAPNITSIDPDVGPVSGGNLVTINGSNLRWVTSVTFGGLQATSITVISDSSITFIPPARGPGLVDVRVDTYGGAVTRTGAYTYYPVPTITSIDPAQGPASGSTLVDIRGTGFTSAGLMEVTFNGTQATINDVSPDGTSMQVSTPVGSAGPATIRLTTPGGSATKTGAYLFVPMPEITAVSPTAGPLAGGTAVTLTGTGFSGATAVQFGGSSASFHVDSDTQITATAPAGAAGTVSVSVTTVGGTGTKTSAYTYVPVPDITSVVPNKGPAAGGATVTITGTNLMFVTSVQFGGENAASYNVDSQTQITSVTPAGNEGFADVEVTTAGGTATSTGAYTYVPAPTIASANPNRGPVSGSNTVIITGTNLTGATLVNFGSTPATSFTVNSNTQITATAPGGDAGAVDVAVTTPGGTATAAAAYTYASAPAIYSVNPDVGPAAGGATVTITGTDLMFATSVQFDGENAASYNVDSQTQITAVTPAGTEGFADVKVTTAGGMATAIDAYTYVPAPTITSVTPITGPTTGGTGVTIAGTGFTDATAVTFGGVLSASYTVVSDTSITATTPVGAPGSVDVVVVTAGGSATLTASYTYAPVPVIHSVNPSVGPTTGGTTVTINGTGFTGTTSVTFGGEPATFTVDSGTQITATVPAGDAEPADITVTTPYGTATAEGAYIYFPVPAITAVSPDEGSEAGGSPVTITGTGFYSVSWVKFGGTISAFTVDSDTQITAIAPSRAAGQVDVTVKTPGGTATAAGAYTYFPVPVIGSIDPVEGPAVGGVSVDIYGSGFTGATSVKFGGTEASYTVISDYLITATTPAGTIGPVDVSVTTPRSTALKTEAYTYVPWPSILSVTPAAGPLAGGNTVTITGSCLTESVAVLFGDTLAGFSVVSDTQITATAPGGVAGAVNVVVMTSGDGWATAVGAYTYIE